MTTYQYPTAQPPKKSRKTLWIVLGLIAAVIAFMCGFAAVLSIFGNTNPTREAVSTPTTATSQTDQIQGSSPTPAAPKVTTPPAKPKPKVYTVGDGIWVVGDDTPAGVYKVTKALTVPVGPGSCYWAITKTGSNGNDIIANDLPSGGFPQVTLKVGQTFETTGCGTWKKVK